MAWHALWLWLSVAWAGAEAWFWTAADPGTAAAAAGLESPEAPDGLFAAGAAAYARGDWAAVVLHMERALRSRAALRALRLRCRSQCAAQHPWEPELGPGPGAEAEAGRAAAALHDLRFFGRLLRRAACLRGCLGPPAAHTLSEELELEFRKRSPYNYLQVAYFKINKLEKAVAAANTFFVGNPEHLEMRQNLDYYQTMSGVKEEDFKDLEAKPHMHEFRLGVRLYSEEQPQEAVPHLEAALQEYFVADEECRALCEGPYDYDGYNYLDYNADLFQSITDHYIQVLSCKQSCVTELASHPSREKPFEDFLPSHYNYLQFAYYNIGNYTQAVECAKTYLLFFPNDEVMNQNLAYYTAMLGEEPAKLLSPRENAQRYRHRSLLEKELLFFAYDVFGIPFVDPDTWTPEEVIPKRLQEKQKTERETAVRISQEIGNLMKEIETLVEEKTKEAVDVSLLAREGGPLLYDGIPILPGVMVQAGLQGHQHYSIWVPYIDNQRIKISFSMSWLVLWRVEICSASPPPPHERPHLVRIILILSRHGGSSHQCPWRWLSDASHVLSSLLSESIAKVPWRLLAIPLLWGSAASKKNGPGDLKPASAIWLAHLGHLSVP
ncbi:prolyl 3-hydroxylase 1 isoform X2 [Petaurus breviceps papuanus]|uniref:prolyl 3-hydroxylase 1 isoform X2 n=1 Tax=Petaurus breviceps papuanus TaxID=3040969 RepID=UPI0036D90F81